MSDNNSKAKALHIALSGHNLLICGAAGTGKSFTIGHIVRELEKVGKNVSLTCTTGIACSLYREMSLNDDDNSLCKICFTQDRDNQWIQCDSCFQWLHRTCAGLKHHLKWKKYQKKGSTFSCSECQ